MILDVTANLDAGNRIDELFQPVTSLQDRRAGNVTSITPKQIEQIKDNRSGWAFLPLLQ